MLCATTGLSLDTLIPGVLQLRLFRPTIYPLIHIYTGFLQRNIICNKMGDRYRHRYRRYHRRWRTIIWCSRFHEPHHNFTTGNDMGNAKHIFLRAIVYTDVSIDLIIVLPSIKYFDLLPIRHSHIPHTLCCEICEVLCSGPRIITL